MLRHIALPAALLTLAAAPPGDPYTPGREIVTDLNKIVTANGVQETYETTLGGARQVVNVRGSDRAKPILLFIHGGPASVEMPLAWSFQRPWEDYFTVVHWDQRGAGRSFPLNDQAALAPTIKPERYRDDTIELIEQLRTRYGKRKIVVMGLSWGSMVGLMVAEKRPDLLYAYVGVGQAINFRENEVEGYAWTLGEAKRRGDTVAVKELTAIAPFPGPGAFDLQKLEIERKWNVRYGGLLWRRPDAQFYFHLGRLSPEYTLADRQAWDAGSAYTMKILWPQLADLSMSHVSRLNVPVVLLLGRHDTTTPSVIAARWYERLQAPKKRLVWFENSAHIPIFEEPGRAFAALLTEVRPLTQPGDDLPK